MIPWYVLDGSYNHAFSLHLVWLEQAAVTRGGWNFICFSEHSVCVLQESITSLWSDAAEKEAV